MLAVVCEELGGVTVTQFHGPRQGGGGVSRCFLGVSRRAVEEDFERTYARSTVSQFHSVFFCALPRAQVAEGERDEPRIAAHFGAIWRHFARLLARFGADGTSRRMALRG